MVSHRTKHAVPVYSTERGRLCPYCGQSVAACVCASNTPPPQGDGIVRIGRESKGRKGGGVTVITGLALAPIELKALARQLKKLCGTGGTAKEGVIEIQGDHRDALMTALHQLGHNVKRSGG